MTCIVCDSAKQELMFKDIKDFEYETYKGVDYVVCKNCGLISQHPLPRADQLKTFYPDDYRNYLPIQNDFFSTLKKIQFKKLANKLSKYFYKDSKILEIGSGNGELLLALKEKGYKNLYGCDFSDKSFTRLKNAGIKLTTSNIEEEFPKFDSSSEIFNGIIMNNVIEHFLNPMQVLKKCKNNLSKEGRIILITPNSNAIEFLIFKTFWAGFHAPRHTFIFNDKNIKWLSKKLDFSEAIVKPIADPAQWAISIQNILQESSITKTKLKNGMSWYLMPLSLAVFPIAQLQNLTQKSTSMMCVLEN